MPVDRFLRITDNFERNVWIKVAQRIIELNHKIDQNRAIMIANAVVKGFGGK